MEVFAHLPGSNLGFFSGWIWQEAAAYVELAKVTLTELT
jgi:hypothetical protein